MNQKKEKSTTKLPGKNGQKFFSKVDQEAISEGESGSKPRLNILKKVVFLFLGFLVLTASFLLIGYHYLSRPFPGRTNFLVLGVAGDERAGSDLTDSIIFLSADHQSGQLLVLSLPRDIWIPELRTKLNSVYHYEGVGETEKIIEKMLGQPIDHSVLVNFDFFKEAVDQFGGVPITVERGFDDYRYPIPGKENDFCEGEPDFGCRYEGLHFEAGEQLMDGERALKFVRSRNAEGEEGTDFARSLRQQKVLAAIQNKILSVEIIKTPQRLIQLTRVLFSHFKTDIPQEKWLDLARIVLKFRPNNLKMEILDGERLINPPPSQKLYDGQWVLVPRSGDWSEIQEYIKFLISNY